jgi:hypothetical protein
MKMNRKIFKPVLETIDSYIVDFQDDDSLSIISCESNSEVNDEVKTELKKSTHFIDKSLNREFKSGSENLSSQTSFDYKMNKEKSYLASLLMLNGKTSNHNNGYRKIKSPSKQLLKYRNQKPTIKSETIKDDCKIEQELNIRINVYLEKHRESKSHYFMIILL